MASLIVPADSNLVTVSAKFAADCDKNVSVFADRGDVTYIEIASYKDGNCSYRERARPADITKWLASKSTEASTPLSNEPIPIKTLNLLIVPLNYHDVPYSPFPKGAFEAVAKSHNLRNDYLSSQWLQSTSIPFNVPLDGGLLGFVMKRAKWNDNFTHFCLSSVFDKSTMHSSCILRISTKEDLQLFKTRLEEVASFAWYPYFLAAILIEKPIQKCPTRTNSKHRINGKTVRTAEQAWNDPEFESAPAEFTSIASDCIKCVFSCSSLSRMINFLKDAHDTNLKAGNVNDEDKAAVMLVEKLKYMTHWIEESRSRFEYIGKRAEVQTQMCNSLMGQRDNALTKKISETSLAVSQSSGQDSAYMRIIALVGLAFLPATFIATMFSTDFFDFQGEGPLVSHWFWLYWAIALPLTVAVYMVWYFSVHKSRREIVEVGDEIELARLSSSNIFRRG